MNRNAASARILIVDDDAELCTELAELLRSEGYAVDTATDGFRTAKLAYEKSHDLLLLDLEIPGVNRPEMVRMLRKKNPALKICVISGNPSVETVLERDNLASSVDAVILKPLLTEPLLERLGALTA